MTTKEIGDIGERVAARYLKKNGYKIKGRNRHFSHNEIDIIAENKSFIVFVEVKTRTLTQEGLGSPSPAAAVTQAKQSRLIRAACDYLLRKPSQKQPRMDVVEVWLRRESGKVIDINHIIDAYGIR